MKSYDVAMMACEMFNAISAAHNKQVAVFSLQHTGRDRALLASYVALRIMQGQVAPLVAQIVTPESWEAVETVIKVLSENINPPDPTPKTRA